MKRIFNPLVVLCLLILVSGCDRLFPTPIGKIVQNPRVYQGKQVFISGNVVDVFSFVVLKYFVVRDATGEIAVVTARPLPKKGEPVKVHGTVQEAFSIGDQHLIVLIEGPAEGN
jgi:hypothetical protein